MHLKSSEGLVLVRMIGISYAISEACSSIRIGQNTNFSSGRKKKKGGDMYVQKGSHDGRNTRPGRRVFVLVHSLHVTVE